MADAGNWQDAETGDAGLDDDDWQPPDDPADPLHWVGVWHECPDVGAGYCARLALFKDGHFESVGGQETCGPELLSSRGTWTLARGALVFSESFRTEWVGGHCKEEGDEMETVGGFKRTINRAKPLVTRVPIRACNKAQAESGGDTLECVRMGAKPRWHKSSNPSDINQD